MISFEQFLHTDPKVTWYPEYDTSGKHNGYDLSGIRALAYEGAGYQGSRTKVFAHLGFPEHAEGPVPAVVLVHGGGGHPEDVWIKRWNQRGYAAISMDTTGFFPTKPIPCLYEGFAEGLERELVPPFAEDGYTVGPNNSEMADRELPLEEQWMYHAVSAVILAHNILRADPRVDSSRIGITGISWGGVITSIVIGHDPRFAFAVPVYGSGYMGCGLSNLNAVFRRSGVQKWFAERWFPRVKMPVLWLCWNDDCCFSVQSNSMSYLETRENHPSTRLSMLHQMRHSHYHGYMPEESYWFADTVLRGEPVPAVSAEYGEGRVQYGCTAPVRSVRLFYITQPMTYQKHEKYGEVRSFMSQEWQTAELDSAKTCASLPEEAVGCYVEFTLENGVVLTTPYWE